MKCSATTSANKNFFYSVSSPLPPTMLPRRTSTSKWKLAESTSSLFPSYSCPRWQPIEKHPRGVHKNRKATPPPEEHPTASSTFSRRVRRQFYFSRIPPRAPSPVSRGLTNRPRSRGWKRGYGSEDKDEAPNKRLQEDLQYELESSQPPVKPIYLRGGRHLTKWKEGGRDFRCSRKAPRV
jgi:hypothetical protein